MSCRNTMRAGASILAVALGLVPAAALAQASPSAGTFAVRYDVQRRETGTIAPDPDGAEALRYAATRNTYDGAGRLVTVEKGELSEWHSEAVAPKDWGPSFKVLVRVDTMYDDMGRKVREALSGSGATTNVTEYSYDKLGRLKCTAQRMNPAAWASRLHLDAQNCLSPGPAGEHGPDRITRNSYTFTGEIETVEEGVGSSEAQVSARYTYTPNGKPLSVTDANGNRSEFRYDGLDRKRCWHLPSKTQRGETWGDCDIYSGDFEVYKYDAAGNIVEHRRRDGKILGFRYDALNRVIFKYVPEGPDLAPAQTRATFYEYDLRGLMTKAHFDWIDGEGITNAYDGFGQLTSTTNTMGGKSRTLNFSYNPDGTRSAITHPDGTTFGYLYDGVGRMIQHYEISGAAGAHQHVVRYWYNSMGLRSAIVRGVSGTGFTSINYYDPVYRPHLLMHDLGPLDGDPSDLGIWITSGPSNQIVSRTVTNNAYAAPAAPIGSVAYKANGLNQYTESGNRTLAYDWAGNLTSDGTNTYTYDRENRLVTARGATNADLVYDPLGRLFQTSGGTAGVTQFLYDGDDLVAEYNASGAMKARYLHGPDGDDPVAVYDGAAIGLANRLYMLPDERGSIVGLIKPDGLPLRVNQYDAWGMPGDNLGRFQYTGQIWIPELRMYHYKARVYSPVLGRFMQTDPIGYGDGLNLYAYVGNDPLNATDPSGYTACRREVGSPGTELEFAL